MYSSKAPIEAPNATPCGYNKSAYNLQCAQAPTLNITNNN